MIPTGVSAELPKFSVRRSMIVLILVIVFPTGFLLGEGTRAAPLDSRIRWEEQQVGIDFGFTCDNYEAAWENGSRFAVTHLLYASDAQQLWAGTAAGVMMCRADGSNPVLVTNAAPGRIGNAGNVISAKVRNRQKMHCVILDLVTLANGDIWAKAVAGAYRLNAAGKSLEDYVTDSEVVEKQYDLIREQAALQRWFPVAGKHVYLPWAGHKVARFDGRRWELIGNLPADGDHYLPARRVYLLNSAPCVPRRGKSGLVDVQANRVVLEDAGVSSVDGQLDEATSVAWNLAGPIWLLKKDRNVHVGDIPTHDPRKLLHDAPGAMLMGGRDAESMGILERGVNDGYSLRWLHFPAGHAFHCFGSLGQDGSRLIGTNRGIVSMDRDCRAMRVLFDIPVPSVPEFWAPVVRNGVAVRACVSANGRVMIGTMVGLARYDLKSKELTWVWKVE